MTIDSSWIASFKEETPEAFTKHIPFQPKAAFCDGQIRLMRGSAQGLLTWDDYIWQQFQSHVKRFYQNHGVSVVILAFDDYEHVPEAKCMTQQKRRRHLPKLEILEREPLPPVCPSGDRWAQCIANRTFKSKVIALVIRNLPKLLNLQAGQSLIIDYAGCPTEFYPADQHLQYRTLDHLAPLGEADVKFTRYADIYKDLLVDSVDGDSVPIALLHHENKMRSLTMGSMRTADLLGAPPRICIYRITTRVDESHETKKTKENEKTEKENEKNEKTPKLTRRTFEYVNIPMLYEALRTVFAQCMGRVEAVSHTAHIMAMFLSLIGLTGTDFSRHMPQISGKSVYGYLPDLCSVLMKSYDTEEGQLDVDDATDCLVGRIYAIKFGSHIKRDPKTRPTLRTVLNTLRLSTLSQRTRDSLPSMNQIACTVRNVNWLLRYWGKPEEVPDPLTTEEGVSKFGFAKKRGLVMYADTA